MSFDLCKPGQDNCQPGDYIEVDSSGSTVTNARQVTIQYGDRLPPTQQSGHLWRKLS